MYSTQIHRDADRALRSIPTDIQKLIVSRINLVARDPMAKNNNVKALEGRDGFRLRVGDYRVLYELNHRSRILHVLDIGHRKEVYR